MITTLDSRLIIFYPFRLSWSSHLLGSVEVPLGRHISKLCQLSERWTFVLFSQRRASWKSRLGTMHLKERLKQRPSCLLCTSRSLILSFHQAIFIFIFAPGIHLYLCYKLSLSLSLYRVIFIFDFAPGDLNLYLCTSRSLWGCRYPGLLLATGFFAGRGRLSSANGQIFNICQLKCFV